MPRLLRKFLGLILLITTIGLSTCQSMLEAAPARASAVELSTQQGQVVGERTTMKGTQLFGFPHPNFLPKGEGALNHNLMGLPVRADYFAESGIATHSLDRRELECA